MPYQIRRRGSRYCVFKEGEREPVPGGCHDTRRQAERHRRALYAAEPRAKALGAGREYMVLISTNAYQDRQGEYIATKALQAYVDSHWQDGQFLADNVLLAWHLDIGGKRWGIPVGRIVWADMEGQFLIEVAEKRRSRILVFQAFIDRVWGMVKASPGRWGASPGFLGFYRPGDGARTYTRMIKRETSVLPRLFAANAATLAKVIEEHE